MLPLHHVVVDSFSRISHWLHGLPDIVRSRQLACVDPYDGSVLEMRELR